MRRDLVAKLYYWDAGNIRAGGFPGRSAQSR